jgi:glutamate synthase domain-containing protein 1/glutamate synthase domain-containing protein 3
MSYEIANKLLASRRKLLKDLPNIKRSEDAAEGGCGVLGFAANIPIAGRHVLTASSQMHNRGNGKGGGIAMVGLDPRQARVDVSTLRSHYLLQIALSDKDARREVEDQFILSQFDVAQAYELEHQTDFHNIPGLEVRPPDVWRYFVRAKSQALADFAAENELEGMPERSVEDEFVYQNTFCLNRQFYASMGEKRAFVLSHGRNLSVLKIVGYAEDVVAYYKLEDQTAHVWIAHQRYPTKGRVWHPGGAHPFVGLNEALVHNGDFANYHAVSEYLRQRNIGQLFLTDTEVSVQLFDLWDRVYGYPLEVTLEAMAPTSEYDFGMLKADKQTLYQAVQRAHIHGSPDGPWFFILARSLGDENSDHFELLGITDTSMLRPQVFALYENRTQDTYQIQKDKGVKIGLIASERQAINACMRSLASEDVRFQPIADKYWTARGGSHTDGGAFCFSVRPGKVDASDPNKSGSSILNCTNKFGAVVRLDSGRWHMNPLQLDPQQTPIDFRRWWEMRAKYAFDDGGAPTMWRWLKNQMPIMTWNELAWGLNWMVEFSQYGDDEWGFVLECLNYLHDRHYNSGRKKRASVLRLVDEYLLSVFESAPILQFSRTRDAKSGKSGLEKILRLNWKNRGLLDICEPPKRAVEEHVLLLDTLGFPSEGDESAARWISRIYERGWRRVVAYNWRGGRFAGCGLGENSQDMRIDLYGDVGDYAASGLDGGQVYIHGDGQDQLGQIMKNGKLVIYGDAGQTFLYGAKGGDVYVLGSVAGRPLINAVGKPRAVINGTCLDYLAESFMAGDPLRGGGFVVLNGMAFDESGGLVELESPYPGGYLFSLASGGAIYLRDPRRKVKEDQLNGGTFAELSPADWALLEPYLRENESLFGIRIEDLLSVDGEQLPAERIYRKVEVLKSSVLSD